MSNVAQSTTPARLTRIAAAAAILWLAPASQARAAPEIGKAAPELVVTELDGQTFDLAKLHGKVVLVNYWATWCAPCRKDMPMLDAFYRSHRQNLEMIGISVDRGARSRQGAQSHGLARLPCGRAQRRDRRRLRAPDGVPITWIIDPDGTVRDRMIDVRDELLNGLVVPLLPH